MSRTIEGIIRNGKVEAQLPDGYEGVKVLLTFAEADLGSAKNAKTKPDIRFGKYAAGNPSTDEDFALAEFHGDLDDGLDWSVPAVL